MRSSCKIFGSATISGIWLIYQKMPIFRKVWGWLGLVGKMLPRPGRVFSSCLGPPSAHLGQKSEILFFLINLIIYQLCFHIFFLLARFGLSPVSCPQNVPSLNASRSPCASWMWDRAEPHVDPAHGPNHMEVLHLSHLLRMLPGLSVAMTWALLSKKPV